MLGEKHRPVSHSKVGQPLACTHVRSSRHQAYNVPACECRARSVVIALDRGFTLTARQGY